MFVIAPWSLQHNYHFTDEKTRLERLCDIYENPPELKSCFVSYKEISAFWLNLTQAGGLPGMSVSSTEN